MYHDIENVKTRWGMIREHVVSNLGKSGTGKSAKECALYASDVRNQEELNTILEVLAAEKEVKENEERERRRKAEAMQKFMEERKNDMV